MPIYPGDVPNEAVEAVSRALAHRAATSAFFPSKLGSANALALAITMPHRVAYLALEDVLGHNPNEGILRHHPKRDTDPKLDEDPKQGKDRTPAPDLREIVQIGSWRFLVQVGSGEMPPAKPGGLPEFEQYESVASATAVQSESGKYQLGELNEGPFVAATEYTIRSAEKMEDVRAGHFEAFFLVVPAVQVGALWLRDRHGKDDKFLTMSTALRPDASASPLRDSDFFSYLYELAKNKSPNYF